MRETTKELIVSNFLDMLDVMPFNKITVRGIVERCDMNRNTFYYHFKDIPDLMETAWKNWIDKIISANFHYGSPIDCISPLVSYASEHKRAILNLYRSMNRESVIAGLDRFASYVVNQYFDGIPTELTGAVRERDMVILRRYYKCLMVGALLDWMNAKMSYDLLSAASRLYELLDGSTESAFMRSAGSPASDS